MPERQPRPLEVNDLLHRTLVKLRRLHARCLSPELDVRVLDEVEAALGYQFSDDVLALFAAGVDELRVHARMDIGTVLKLNVAARKKGCPEDLVVIGGRPDERAYYAVQRAPDPGQLEQLIIFDAEEGALTGQPLRAWVQGTLEQLRESMRDRDPEERALARVKVGPAEFDRFKPALIAVVAAEPAVRRVHHPKFGEGEVLRELDSGPGRKLEVRFADGVKVLLARVFEKPPG